MVGVMFWQWIMASNFYTILW